MMKDRILWNRWKKEYAKHLKKEKGSEQYQQEKEASFQDVVTADCTTQMNPTKGWRRTHRWGNLADLHWAQHPPWAQVHELAATLRMAWKSERERLKSLGSCAHVGDPDRSSWLQIHSAQRPELVLGPTDLRTADKRLPHTTMQKKRNFIASAN